MKEKKIINRSELENNCLNCFISEMEIRRIMPADILKKGVVIDQVLEEICVDKKQNYKCKNRTYFENDSILERPHLSTLHSIYRIQEMCNRG